MSVDIKKYVDEGLNHSKSGRHIEALECYDKAISLNKKDYFAWLAKGNALCRLKLYEESIEAFDQSISLNKENILAWQSKGLALYNLGQFEESIKTYDEAITLNKTNGFSWKGKGDVLNRLGRHEDAISAYDIAISLEPKYASPWSRKGKVFFDLGRYEEAINAYSTAIELDPKNVDSWIGKGNVHNELDLFAEAAICFDTAISLNSKPYHAWYGKGIALNKLNRYGEALICFDKAVSLGPEQAECWHRKGQMLNNLGRYGEALIAYEKAVLLDPSIPSHWNGKGNALYGIGRTREAIICFEEAIAIDPAFYVGWHGKGNAFNDLGRYEEALNAYEEVIARNPEFAESWHGIGNSLSRLGRYDDALSAYDKAISLKPKISPPWIGKACLYDELGDVRQAHVCLTRAYFLSGQSTFSNILKFASKLITKYFSDLFIYRIYREHSFVMTSYKWTLNAISALERSVDILQFIRFVNRFKGFYNEVERKKFLGIIYLYLGDPLEAHKIFDEVDSLDDEDLMGQYYLVASMNAFEEPANNEMDFAVKKAQKILSSQNEVGPDQSFYAGLLLCLDEQYESSIVAFQIVSEKDENYLAAQYMMMLSYHRLKNYEERNKLIKVILKKERLSHAEGKQGFIGGVFLKSFDLISTRWDRPFLKYARWVEISEAIRLIHELVERHDFRHGELPYKIRFLDETKDEPEDLLRGWVQNEKFVAEIEKAKADMDRDDIEVMSCELKKSFHYSFFMAQPDTKKDFEFEIGQLIQELENPVKHNTQRYHDLIAYCYFHGKISGRSYALLTYYLFYQLYKHEQKKGKPYVEEAIKATLFEALSYLFSSVTGLSLSKMVSPAVYAGFSLSYNKIRELALNKEGAETVSYAGFKTHLNHFFVELAKKKRDLPESVKSLWMSAE